MLAVAPKIEMGMGRASKPSPADGLRRYGLMDNEHLIPRIVSRRCGGWLAVSNDADPVKIGVVAVSEADANREFQATRERWRAILELEVASERRRAFP